MPIVPISGLGDIGLVKDVAPYEIPLNGWSNGQNVVFRELAVQKIAGHSSVFGAPSIAPYNLRSVPTSTALYWLLLGLSKVYVWDGASHINITRQSAGVDVDYNASATLNWTTSVLGGIPVLNNGVDAPQMWLPVSTGTKLAALSNWPASTTCRSLRAFKSFLVALDVTEVSGRFPTMVRWSHPADPGSVPSSWDYTDTTKDAGRVELKQSSDFMLDSIALRDINVLYREASTWGMQFIGGINIFRFFLMFSTLGALSRRCAVEYFPGKHFVFASDDIVIHDGQQAQSLLTRRVRSALFNSIDNSNYATSFVVSNQATRSVWACYPETGNALPNKALVWNWESNTIGDRDLPLVPAIVPGVIDPGATSNTWDGDATTWDSDTTIWDERGYNPSSLSLALADPTNSLVYIANSSAQFNGVNYEAFVERTGLGIPLKVNAPPDFTTMKMLRGVWPRIEGTLGGIVQVSIGVQQDVNGPVTWKPSVNYTIGSTRKIDTVAVGRLFAIRYSSNTAIQWKLQGHEFDVVARGMY